MNINKDDESEWLERHKEIKNAMKETKNSAWLDFKFFLWL